MPPPQLHFFTLCPAFIWLAFPKKERKKKTEKQDDIDHDFLPVLLTEDSNLSLAILVAGGPLESILGPHGHKCNPVMH